MIALLGILVPPALYVAYVVLLPHLNHINPWYWRKRYEGALIDIRDRGRALAARQEDCAYLRGELALRDKQEGLLRSELEMRTDQAMQLRKDVAKAKAAFRKLKAAK